MLRSFVLLQATSENSSMDMWTRIAVRTYAARVRNDRATRVVHVCSVEVAVAVPPLPYCCCAAAAAAARIGLLLLLYAVRFLLPTTWWHCCWNNCAVVRFLLCDVEKLNFGTSLSTRYVSGPVCAHTKVGRRTSRDTNSLLLSLAAAASSSICRWWAAAAACFKL